jgi:hypothetical protein
MSMYRSRNQRKRWRLKWPWKVLFPLRVDERFCPECRMPFHEGPLPKEAQRFDVNSVAVFVFPAGGWKSNELTMRVGRWRASGKQLYSSEFIPLADIDDLLAVVQKAKEELSVATPTRGRRRAGLQ